MSADCAKNDSAPISACHRESAVGVSAGLLDIAEIFEIPCRPIPGLMAAIGTTDPVLLVFGNSTPTIAYANSMRLSIGTDHGGFPLKSTVINVCKELGHQVTDHGCYDETPVDFPDVTRQVCADVVAGKADRAILVCGTGVGASIAANKIPGIRASIVHDGHIAHQCVEHDGVNEMCVGAKVVGPWLAVDLVRGYLAAVCSTDEDCRRRVAKLVAMESSYTKRPAE